MGPYFEGGLKTPMWFTGSVTSTVDLGIVNLDVRSKKPAKGKNPESDAEFGITLKAGKGAKEPPMLWLERVETGGTLTKLTGVKLKGTLSKLYLTDCGEIVLKAAPANFDAKDLTGTTVKYKDRAGVMHSWP